MDEYIDREAAIKAIEFNKGVGCSDRCVQGIKYIPAADVKPVVRGEWVVDTVYPSGVKNFHCSVCGQARTVHEKYEGVFQQNFCPNCGADMREGE